jgi:hypothetical protein
MNILPKPAIAGVFLSRLALNRDLSTTLGSKNWKGSHPKDHITETDDSHNVQIDGAKGGAMDRGSPDGSSAATEKDPGKRKQKAKVDHPKAPEPIIGMNDERGDVCMV